jgi:hypothetical protein
MINVKIDKMDTIDVAKIDQALDYVWDILARSQIEFMLFGDTAYSIINNTMPKYQKVYLGVKRNDLTEFGRRILTLTTPGATDDGHKIKFDSPEGVPIEIRIVNKDYPFFDRPDTILWRQDAYKIPNPFDKYWKVYRLIQ